MEEKEYKEFDSLIDSLKEEEANSQKINKTLNNYSYATTSAATNSSNNKLWQILIGVGAVIIFISVFFGSCFGGNTLVSGPDYKLTGEVSYSGGGAYINANLKSDITATYQVTVNIYSSGGTFLGSNYEYYRVEAGESVSVRFSIINSMGTIAGTPEKYRVTVQKLY